MKYPKWLPYPKAWGQAIMLFVELIPVVFIVRTFLPIKSIFYYTSSSIHLTHGILSIIALFFTIYGLAFIHQLFWDEPDPKLPKWCPRRRCWLEGLWGISIFTLSLFLGFLVANNLYQHFGVYSSKAQSIMVILGIISVGYSYHFRNLFFKNYVLKSQKKVDTIEQELNGIKSDFGIKKMNDVNKYD